MKRIKAKANAMEDADVNFISLVTRPASRIPFRITKAEDDPEEGVMIHLRKMFKRDGEQPKGCALAAIVLQKQHEDHFAPKLKGLGVKMDARTEEDGIVMLKQFDFEEDQVTPIKLGELGALFTNVPEEVKKQFDSFPESEDFDENMNTTGFLPSVGLATEMLVETVRNVLRAAGTAEDAKAKIADTIDSYKDAVLSLASMLPEVAFKIETFDLEGFVAKTEGGEGAADQAAADAGENGNGGDDKAGEGSADDGEGAAGDETNDAAGDESGDAGGEADADSGEGGGEGEGAGDSEPIPADAGASGAEATGRSNIQLTDAEKEALKGVHIEDLDTGAGASGDGKSSSEKSGESEPKDGIAGLLAALKSEVLGAISSVKSDVADLKTKQDKLTEKVDATAELAEKASKAVKGTVPSNSDGGDPILDESLGTRGRRKGETADEKQWGGTALDRIVGDYPNS